MAGRARTIKRGIALILLLGFGFAVWFYGPLFLGLWRHGVFDRPSEQRAYEGTSIDNLRAMRTALLGFEDSEGQFPAASGWMDAIKNRLRTDDLRKGEESKKLVYPGYLGQEGKFGYALNDAVSGKYHADLKDPKTILVFESTSTERSAHGEPAKVRRPGGIAIAIDGEIIR